MRARPCFQHSPADALSSAGLDNEMSSRLYEKNWLFVLESTFLHFLSLRSAYKEKVHGRMQRDVITSSLGTFLFVLTLSKFNA
jgi:hypothetical protein